MLFVNEVFLGLIFFVLSCPLTVLSMQSWTLVLIFLTPMVIINTFSIFFHLHELWFFIQAYKYAFIAYMPGHNHNQCFYIKAIMSLVEVILSSQVVSLPLCRRHKLYNRVVIRGFFADAYFSRSAAHRPIFLTLNQVVKSASGRLKAAVGRLFGHHSISSGNDQIFGRCPADDRPEAYWWPSGFLSIAGGRQWILRSSAGHRSVSVRPSTGSVWVEFGNLDL